jgi:hypothetical protein
MSASKTSAKPSVIERARWRTPLPAAPWRTLSSIVAGFALLLLLGAYCLEGGMWTRTESLRGPLNPEVLGSSTYTVPVGFRGRASLLFDARGDDAGATDLRLWVNGEEWGPGHAAHTEIRGGNTRAFSHWNGSVYLWLPAEIANSNGLDLRVTYSVHLRPVLLQSLVLVAPGLLFLHLWLFGLRRRIADRPVLKRWAPRLLLLFPIVSWLAIFVGIFYFGTILWGSYAGYALPTATVFDLIPFGRRLAAIEPYTPTAMLVFAGLGAGAAWLASLHVLPRFAARRIEVAQRRLWRRWGLPLILAMLIFSVSSAGWNGHIRSTDFNYVSFAALVPNSDAANYLTGVADQIQFGTWGVLGSRRPLAEAFRELTAFAVRYSYVGMLLLQTVLVGLMLFIAAGRIASWRGAWAAIAFVGLISMLARPYLPTLMSEPLGMIWSLFCVIFLVEALRRRSSPHALVALLALTIGLWTRMGAMFAVPVAMMWLILTFSETASGRMRLLLAASGAVLSVIVVNGVLATLYGDPTTVTGANFAYVVCGLSLGGDWAHCANTYAADLNMLDERSRALFLLSKAWHGFLLHPGIAIARLFGNASEFILGWPRFFLSGEVVPNRSMPDLLPLAALCLVPGLLYALRSRSSWTERAFWLALWVSVTLSATIVFGDAGWRNMHVTNALLAVFVALGFTAPGIVVAPAREPWVVRSRNGMLIVTVASLLFIVTPALARVFDRIELHSEFGSPQQGIHLVAGGRWPTGFLVIADGASRPVATASLSFSEFSRMIRLLNLEAETGPFLDEAGARLPFAFMTAPDIDQRNTTALYIAPPHVLNRREVKVWRFVVPEARRGNIVRVVEQAEPPR